AVPVLCYYPVFTLIRRLTTFTLFSYTTLFRSPRFGSPPTIISPSTARSTSGTAIASCPRPLGGTTFGTTSRSSGASCPRPPIARSEEHTSELQSREKLVCRLLLEKKK